VKVLEGRVAIVTGASKGIGKGLAIGLAEHGADVAVNFKNDAAGANDTTRSVEAAGRKAATIQADVGSSVEARRLIDEACERLGRIDILVNNAGRTRFGPAFDITEEDWDDVVNTNLRGTFFTSIAAAERMRKQGGGTIINISSMAAELMVPDHSVYTMSKGGVEALTRQLALDWAPTIRVNVIAPAATSIERNLQYDPNFVENWARVIPMGRVAYPEDLVGPLVFLASDQSAFLTGEVLHVDGGWSLKGHVPSMDDYDFSADRRRG
jgi:NAD(P)-dependent dehydrogenase (short-subunit alcohol dehydrogenase family)